jgi:Xaa-Pro aminopeptidase
MNCQVRFLAWLEYKLSQGYEITEYEAASRLTEYRRQNKHFMGLAYENISASGPNAGEIILHRSHYEVIRLHFPFHPSVASLLAKEVPSPDD